MAVAAETVVGSHVLTIDGYTKTTAALAVGDTILSDHFRVGGHSWYIKCCPRRQNDKGAEWLSISLCLHHHHDVGSEDNYEVKASPEFILLDRAGNAIQSCGSGNLIQTFTASRYHWGFDEFIQRKALEAHLLNQDDDCCRIRCDVTVVKEPPPSPDLHGRRLGDLLLASEVGRDVTFVVAGEHFTAHSCVLAARTSTAFVAEVLAGTTTTESTAAGGGSRHVRVDGVAPWVFRALLRFVYTNSLPDVEDDGADLDVRIGVARGLQAAADRYDMERLKMMCNDVLCSNAFTATALPTLLQSHKLGNLKLNQACVKYIRDMLDGYSLEETT